MTRTATPALFDLAPRERRITSKELVPVSTARCPNCGSSLRRVTMEEPNMFRHGGYGATRRTITDHCSGDDPDYFLTGGGVEGCHWKLIRSVQEVRP